MIYRQLDAMKFAIFDFQERGEIEVGGSKWLENIDESLMNNDSFDFNQDVAVKWPTQRGNSQYKLYSGRIIIFGDNKLQLTQLVKKIIDRDLTDFAQVRQDALNKLQQTHLGRGKRDKWSKLFESSSEEEELTQPTKKNKINNNKKDSAEILEKMKKKLMEEAKERECHQEQVDSEQEDLRSELLKVQAENQMLKASLFVFTGLPGMTRDLKENIQCLTEVCSDIRSQTQRSQPINSTLEDSCGPDDSVLSCEELQERVSNKAIERCSTENPQKFVNDLMTAMFSMEYLATHSSSGYKSSKIAETHDIKPPMDKEDKRFIISEVQKKFPDRRESDVKTCIRIKLNNASKVARRRRATQSDP